MPNRTAEIKTNKGTIKFELLEQDAPKTTENFRLLAEKGFYDGDRTAVIILKNGEIKNL